MTPFDASCRELLALASEQREAALRLDASRVEALTIEMEKRARDLLASQPTDSHRARQALVRLRRELFFNLQLMAHARDSYREAIAAVRGAPAEEEARGLVLSVVG